MNPAIVAKLRAWHDSPLLFVTECIGATPSNQQAELLVAAGKCKRMTVRSGHGCGKSSAAAWLILHFLTTRAYAKVVCTAPTARQLSDVLWTELSKWLRKSILAEEFVIQKDKIFHKDAPKEHWARAVSPSVKASKEEQAETLAGFHSDHLLIVVDEASGVEDPVFIPLEGALTQEDNRVLLIGNPTRNTGYFHETQFHPEIAKKWAKLHWDSRKSTNVTKDMIEYFRDKYGEDSNVFRIRVKGEPPLDDAKSFIPLHWCEQCIGNDIDIDAEWPLIFGVDVAREGDDDSIILPRRGLKIYPWSTYHGIHTIELSNRVLHDFIDLEATMVGIDTVGVGGGVYDWLVHDPRGLGMSKVVSCNVAESPMDKAKHHRLRDELWDRVRENCMRRKYSFPDNVVKIAGADIHIGRELCNELSSVHYETESGKIKIESKKHMKDTRGIRSPNIADALCISEYVFAYAFTNWTVQERRKLMNSKKAADSYFPGKHNWMIA